MKLPRELTTVTPLSKLLAIFLFVSLPVVGFLLGTKYYQTISRTESTTIEPCDLNSDGQCDITDFAIFKQALGQKRGDIGYNPRADTNADGIVTSDDASLFPFPITLPVETPTKTSSPCPSGIDKNIPC